MRSYQLPALLPGESNAAWLERAAASIPAEALMQQVVAYLLRREKKGRWRRPAWSVISDMTAHGCGVSCAIVKRFTKTSDTPMSDPAEGADQ